MYYCPKCGCEINSKVKECPTCNTIIIRDNVEVLDDLPITKDEKYLKEVVSEKKNTKKKKILIDNALKPIPLTIKPITKPKKEKKVKNVKKKSGKKNNSFRVLSSVLLLAMLVMLVASIYNIGNIIYELEHENETNTQTIVDKVLTSDNIIGKWQTSDKGLFTFDEEHKFFLYNNSSDLSNNFYQGTYTLKEGVEAITEMGYTIEEFEKTFPEEIEVDDIYSVMLTPELAILNNKDVSKKNIKNNETWWFLFILNDQDNAQAYNKKLDIRYKLSREIG